MSSLLMIFGTLQIAAGIAIMAVSRYRTNRLMDSLEQMLDQAIKGEYIPGQYDESRVSRLEEKLGRFLDSSTISARNVEIERDRIKTLISDISHQTKTPIANLLLYSELLEDMELSAEQEAYIRAIHSQTKKCNS